MTDGVHHDQCSSIDASYSNNISGKGNNKSYFGNTEIFDVVFSKNIFYVINIALYTDFVFN